ncbi:hypothetical protein JCM11641_004774 [Rhodosporidiobolus odoratus]
MSGPASKKQRLTSLPASTVAPGTNAIPLARVGKVVKADREVRVCSKEALFLITKATELMLGKITTQAYHNARMDKRQKMVRYSDLDAAVHNNPSWFYLHEVVPTPLPLGSALKLRTTAADDSSTPAAVTTSAPSKPFEGKRVMKGKGRKSAPSSAVVAEALALGAAGGGGEELGKRKTRGKKLKLPPGEGGGEEEDSDAEDEAEGDEEYSEVGGSRAVSEAGHGMEVDQ